MRKSIFSVLIVLLSGVLLAACGVPGSSAVPPSPTTRTPTSATTSVPAAATPGPLTVTPEPPAASPLAPTATRQLLTPTPPPQEETANGKSDDFSIAKTILAGMKRTRSATVFRIEEQTVGKGGFENVLLFLGLRDPNEEGLLHRLTLECNGEDCASLIKGGSASLFGADRDRGIESLTVNGDGYMHGPLPLLELSEDGWYRQPGQPNPFAISTLSSTELYGYVDNGANPGAEIEERLATFAHSGRETLDGIQCDVYETADKEITFDAMRTKIGVNLSISDVAYFEGDGTTEFKIWICDDGYFHQMELQFVGFDNTRPDTTVERTYRLHIFDYHGDVVITPPAEAITLTPTTDRNEK